MPSLAQATSTSIEGLGLERAPVSLPSLAQQPSVSTEASGFQFTRCAIPPVQAGIDSVRIYERMGAFATDRILPTPPLYEDTSSGSGSTTTTTRVTSISGGTVSQGSSGSTSIKATSLSTHTSTFTSQNTGFTTPAINQGQPYMLSLPIAKTFLLAKVSVNAPARVELYATAGAQLGDFGRAADTAVPLGTSIGLIADLYLSLPSEASWLCSPMITGFSGEDSATVYVTVTNLSPSTAPISVSLFYLPLEI